MRFYVARFYRTEPVPLGGKPLTSRATPTAVDGAARPTSMPFLPVPPRSPNVPTGLKRSSWCQSDTAWQIEKGSVSGGALSSGPGPRQVEFVLDRLRHGGQQLRLPPSRLG